jgi:hypothetical protein
MKLILFYMLLQISTNLVKVDPGQSENDSQNLHALS